MMMSSCIAPVGRLSEPAADRNTSTGLFGARKIVYQPFDMEKEILYSASLMRAIRN
jgi:hypothetical protein